MEDELSVDVPLEEHIDENEQAHEEIREKEDEDYVWLTTRLDALDARFADVQAMATTEMGVARSQMADALSILEDSRQTIRTLITIVETIQAKLAEMSASMSVLSRSIPNNSASTLQEPLQETVQETVQVKEPESASIQNAKEEKSSDGGGKKRRRI